MSVGKTIPLLNERHRRIAERAYFYREERGRPIGSPEIDWFRAEMGLEKVADEGLWSSQGKRKPREITRITMSGFSSLTRATAWRPSAASPTISQSRCFGLFV
jgi:hypothetical protein